MKASNNNVFLVLTAAVVIGGEIAKRGSVVEVTNAEARDMLHRKKARIATAEDGVEVDDQGQAQEAQEVKEKPAAKPRKPAEK